MDDQQATAAAAATSDNNQEDPLTTTFDPQQEQQQQEQDLNQADEVIVGGSDQEEETKYSDQQQQQAVFSTPMVYQTSILGALQKLSEEVARQSEISASNLEGIADTLRQLAREQAKQADQQQLLKLELDQQSDLIAQLEPQFPARITDSGTNVSTSRSLASFMRDRDVEFDEYTRAIEHEREAGEYDAAVKSKRDEERRAARVNGNLLGQHHRGRPSNASAPQQSNEEVRDPGRDDSTNSDNNTANTDEAHALFDEVSDTSALRQLGSNPMLNSFHRQDLSSSLIDDTGPHRRQQTSSSTPSSVENGRSASTPPRRTARPTLMPSAQEMAADASINHRTLEAQRHLNGAKEFGRTQSEARSFNETDLQMSSPGIDGNFQSIFLAEARSVARKTVESQSQRTPTNKILLLSTPFKHPQLEYLDTRNYQTTFAKCIHHEANPNNAPVYPMRLLAPSLVTAIHDGCILFMADPSLPTSYGLKRKDIPSKESFYTMNTSEASEMCEIYLRPYNMKDYERLWASSQQTVMKENGFNMNEPLRPDQEGAALIVQKEIYKHQIILLQFMPQISIVTTQQQLNLGTQSSSDQAQYGKHPTFPGLKLNTALGLSGLTAINNNTPIMSKTVDTYLSIRGETMQFTFAMQIQEVIETADRQMYHQALAPMNMAKRPGGIFAVDLGIALSHVDSLHSKQNYTSGRSLNPFNGGGRTSRALLPLSRTLSGPRRDGGDSRTGVTPQGFAPNHQQASDRQKTDRDEYRERLQHNGARQGTPLQLTFPYNKRKAQLQGEVVYGGAANKRQTGPMLPATTNHLHHSYYSTRSNNNANWHNNSQWEDGEANANETNEDEHSDDEHYRDVWDYGDAFDQTEANLNYLPTANQDESNDTDNEEGYAAQADYAETYAANQLSSRLHEEEENYDRLLEGIGVLKLDNTQSETGQPRVLATVDPVPQRREPQNDSRHSYPQHNTQANGKLFDHRAPRGVQFDLTHEQRERRKTQSCIPHMSGNACTRGSDCSFSHDPEVHKRTLQNMLNVSNDREAAARGAQSPHRYPPPPPAPPERAKHHAENVSAVQHRGNNPSVTGQGTRVDSAARTDSGSQIQL
jgi:hypothetical protein